MPEHIKVVVNDGVDLAIGPILLGYLISGLVVYLI